MSRFRTALVDFDNDLVPPQAMGSKLVRKDWVAASDWETIDNQVCQALAWIQEDRR